MIRGHTSTYNKALGNCASIRRLIHLGVYLGPSQGTSLVLSAKIEKAQELEIGPGAFALVQGWDEYRYSGWELGMVQRYGINFNLRQCDKSHF